MSFVTTVPEALAFAASQLQTIGASITGESAAAAAPTTGVAPAAADQVSLLQSTIFSSYGGLYQSVYAEAQAIHEQFVATLTASSGTYAATEATNKAATGLSAASPQSAFEQLITFLSQNGPLGFSGSYSLTGLAQVGNFASAASDDIGMAGGGMFTSLGAPAAAGAEGAAADLAGTTSPAAGSGMVGMGGMAGMGGVAGMGATPVTAGMGQATLAGKLSVPPSWAGGAAVPEVAPGAATLTGAGWTTAAPQAGAPVTAMPGMPGAGAAARHAGYGAPRYGVKPIVMPKPAVV